MVRSEGLRSYLASGRGSCRKAMSPLLFCNSSFFRVRLAQKKALDPHHPDGMYQEVPLRHHSCSNRVAG